MFACASDRGVVGYLMKGGEEGREVGTAGTIGIRRVNGMFGLVASHVLLEFFQNLSINEAAELASLKQ